MPTVDVVDLSNRKVEELDLADSVFAAPVNENLIYQAVVAYRAARRAGSHKVKGRAEVRGSGRKPWRQKGTGRARIGSNRSPLRRGGGTVHGPQPRDHSQKLPRKMLVGALRSALSARLQDSGIVVVRDFELASHKTRAFLGALETLGAGPSVLVVDNGPNRNLRLSSRNLQGVRVVSSYDLHPYSVLKYRRILMSAEAARKCSEVLA